MVRGLRERGIRIPTVYNLSGYQRVESLRLIEPVADIYLPDFKYADAALARSFSQCADYAAVALETLCEMVRQRGFLDTFVGDDGDVAGTEAGKTAREGVLVRHLILPGHVDNSLQVLNMLFLEFGRNLPISLMSQYVPVRKFPVGSPLNRQVTRDEFQAVFQHARELGFRNLFVQSPEEVARDAQQFLPDFSAVNPFRGNMRNWTPTGIGK